MKKLTIIVLAGVLAGCGVSPNYYNSTANSLANRYENLRKTSRLQVDSYSKELTAYLAENGEEAAVKKATASVANSLKDPSSAQFRNVRIASYKGGSVVCGEVNGKNSYGGYVGFRPFVAGISESMFESRGGRYPEIDRAANAGLIEACGT